MLLLTISPIFAALGSRGSANGGACGMMFHIFCTNSASPQSGGWLSSSESPSDSPLDAPSLSVSAPRVCPVAGGGSCGGRVTARCRPHPHIHSCCTCPATDATFDFNAVPASHRRMSSFVGGGTIASSVVVSWLRLQSVALHVNFWPRLVVKSVNDVTCHMQGL